MKYYSDLWYILNSNYCTLYKNEIMIRYNIYLNASNLYDIIITQ